MKNRICRVFSVVNWFTLHAFMLHSLYGGYVSLFLRGRFRVVRSRPNDLLVGNGGGGGESENIHGSRWHAWTNKIATILHTTRKVFAPAHGFTYGTDVFNNPINSCLNDCNWRRFGEILCIHILNDGIRLTDIGRLYSLA